MRETDDCHYCAGLGVRPSARVCDNCSGTGMHEPKVTRMRIERERAEKAVDEAWEKNRY